MNLRSFLGAEKFVMNLAGTSQRETLTALIQPLLAAGIVTDGEAFLTDLESREAQITTVMDNGVALPHARSHAVRRLGLTVGLTSPEGVTFHPGSEQRSYLFFCIAVPSFAPTAHIPLLQALAKFARDPNRVEKLLSSKSPGVASRYLCAFKG